MSKDEYLRELLRWVSAFNMLVIDKRGNLRRIYCPFKVVCLVTSEISQGEKVSVEAIKLTAEIKEVYIIKGTPYFIIYFKIIVDS